MPLMCGGEGQDQGTEVVLTWLRTLHMQARQSGWASGLTVSHCVVGLVVLMHGCRCLTRNCVLETPAFDVGDLPFWRLGMGQEVTPRLQACVLVCPDLACDIHPVSVPKVCSYT